LQHAKENRVHRRRDHLPPPQVKLEEDVVMTEAIVLDSLRRALDGFSSAQARDGHWPAGYSGVLFILPGMVRSPAMFISLLVSLVYKKLIGPCMCLQIFAMYVTGSLNTVISGEHRREILRYIYNHQAWQSSHLLIDCI
jgi:hypothetical protein